MEIGDLNANLPCKKKINIHNDNIQYRRYHAHRGSRKTSRIMALIFYPAFFLIVYMPAFNNLISRRNALSDWGFNVSRNISDYVLPDIDTTLIEPSSICQSKIFILIIVFSDVNNFDIRKDIRETWAKPNEFNYSMFSQMHSSFKGKYLELDESIVNFYQNFLHQSIESKTNIKFRDYDSLLFPVRVVFLLGRTKYENDQRIIQQEANTYNDIIQEDFMDTYNNLTIKSVMMLKWLRKMCLDKIAFVMKSDDDVFINIPNLLHYLLGGTVPLYNDTIEYCKENIHKVRLNINRINSTHNVLAGFLFCSSRPNSDVHSKWYTPFYMYSDNIYPNYLSGASYVMSADAVSKLYEVALITPLIHLEDLFITGICAKKIQLQLYHNCLFRIDPILHYSSYCNLRGSISQHYIKGEHLRKGYAFVKNLAVQCFSPEKEILN